MTEIKPSSLLTKYKQSSQGWILPLPIKENGKYKIRCFMNRSEEKDYDGEPIVFFQDVYTYKVPNLEFLTAFFMFQSFGQAYNGFLRNKQDRSKFIKEEDHQKGKFLMEKVIKSSFLGNSADVCQEIQKEFNRIGFEFNLKPIKTKKTLEELYLEVEQTLNKVRK